VDITKEGGMEEEKEQFSKIIVMLIVIMNIWFTVAVLSVFAKTGSEPVTLVTAFFAFTTGELWLMASIKKTKVVKQKRSEVYGNLKDGLGEKIDK
jgi:hydrogenase-4 membrane subunit HyfE